MLSRREQLILLNLIPGVGSLRLRKLLEAFGSLEGLWAANAQAITQVDRIGPELASRIVQGRGDVKRLDHELTRAKQLGARIVTREDAEYPAPLREISDPPLAMYIKGRLLEIGEAAVSLVGARGASLYGLQVAERLAYELALRGVAVISGLARGIDAAAHRGALKAGGKTIAVLGSGLDRMYPPDHADLAEEIAEQGALVSEYPLGTRPATYNFPRRNRLISGLSLGVVVVEAGPHSGALITADQALEQGREVFAVPGPITAPTSQGTHQLVKQGAKLVTSVDDILEELRLTPQPAEVAVAASTKHEAASLSDVQERVLSCLSAEEAKDVDALAVETGLSVAALPAVLLHLELKRTIRQVRGHRFVKT